MTQTDSGVVGGEPNSLLWQKDASGRLDPFQGLQSRIYSSEGKSAVPKKYAGVLPEKAQKKRIRHQRRIDDEVGVKDKKEERPTVSAAASAGPPQTENASSRHGRDADLSLLQKDKSLRLQHQRIDPRAKGEGLRDEALRPGHLPLRNVPAL